jgi:putative transposase
MPGPKRSRRERTDEWASIKQWTLWPEQTLYEEIRPIILFGQTPGERAKEIDAQEPRNQTETFRSLPEEIRQLIVDLHCEMPAMSWREIADICFIRFGRKPSHHSVKHIATSGTPPPLQARRYLPWHQINSPTERRLAVVRLHSEGWSITSIAAYLQVNRKTVYATLQRWAEEEFAGLPDKSKARKGPRKVTLKVRNEIRKLQENPRLGRIPCPYGAVAHRHRGQPRDLWPDHGREPATLRPEKPQRQPRAKLEMPFKAERRHQYWSADIRYIEEHLLPDPKPVYVITIFENFSRMVLSSAISATQTQWDFLSGLANAIQRYGAPEALVTDGGGQFYSTVAVQLYDMLGIRKERIDPGQPWENYAETLFSIQRRLGDHAFSNARTWPEIHQAHQTWVFGNFRWC